MQGQIEAMIASPPERDELVVQLFIRDGLQWGEIFRDGGDYLIEIFTTGSLELNAEEMGNAICRSVVELKERLETKS